MFRPAVAQTSSLVVAVVAQRRRLSQSALLSARHASGASSEIASFVTDVLREKKLASNEIKKELSRLEDANIKTMDLLQKLKMADWDALGVSVGAARSIQEALWEMRQNEAKVKTETNLSLRRENSRKQMNRQKRL